MYHGLISTLRTPIWDTTTMNLNPNTCQPRVVLLKPRSSLNPALACSTSESTPPLEPSPQMFQWVSRTSGVVWIGCWLRDDTRCGGEGYMQAGIPTPTTGTHSSKFRGHAWVTREDYTSQLYDCYYHLHSEFGTNKEHLVNPSPS